MRLVDIIAEWYYLKDHVGIMSLCDQEGSVKETYYRIAHEAMPLVISGYLRRDREIAKKIRGGIKSFISAHGQLTKDNFSSLEKRITSSLLKDN